MNIAVISNKLFEMIVIANVLLKLTKCLTQVPFFVEIVYCKVKRWRITTSQSYYCLWDSNISVPTFSFYASTRLQLLVLAATNYLVLSLNVISVFPFRWQILYFKEYECFQNYSKQLCHAIFSLVLVLVKPI